MYYKKSFLVCQQDNINLLFIYHLQLNINKKFILFSILLHKAFQNYTS